MKIETDHSNHHPAHDIKTYEDLIELYIKLVENGDGYRNVSNEDRDRYRPALTHDAKRWINSLMHRQETSTWTRLDEWTIAIETHLIISKFVHDPHDWDHIRTAIELTEYIIESR